MQVAISFSFLQHRSNLQKKSIMRLSRLTWSWSGTTLLCGKRHHVMCYNPVKKIYSGLNFCQWEKLRQTTFLQFFSVCRHQSQCCQFQEVNNNTRPRLGDALVKETSPVELDLDIGSRLLNPAELQRNLQLRKMNNYVNLQKLARDYNKLVITTSEKNDLELETDSMIRKLKEISKLDNEVTVSDMNIEEQKASLQQNIQKHRQSLKSVMKEYTKLKQGVTLIALGLPNILSDNTPETEEKIIAEHNRPDTHQASKMSHVDIGQKFNLIKFSNCGENAHFLKRDAALLEQTLINYFTSRLSQVDFEPISAPEFIKDFVVEGCGTRLEDTFILHREDDEKERSVMETSVIGSSLAQISAFLTKVNISVKMLPLKYFSVGRSYQPARRDTEVSLPGLFSCTQTVKAAMCTVCDSNEESYKIMSQMQTDLWDMYKPLNIPMRLCVVPPSSLDVSEQQRTELQIWIPSAHLYLPIASVSYLGDYVSRRLMIRRGLRFDSYFDSHLVHMVYGEALDTSRLIAALLEYGKIDHKQNIFELPVVPCFEEHSLSPRRN